MAKKIKTQHKKQLNYLSQPAFLEEANYPPALRYTVTVVLGSLLLLIAWASITKMNDVAIAPGEVVTEQYTQLIQHLEGGILSSIEVKEGDVVAKGQVVATLDGLGFKKDLERLTMRQLILQLQAERLNAFLNDTTPNFDDLGNGHEDLKQEQIELFESMTESHHSEIAIIQKQILQKEEVIYNLESRQETISKSISLLKEEHGIKEKLSAEGAVSKVSFLKVSQQLNELEGKFKEAASAITQTQSSILELESRILSIKAKNQRDTLSKLEDIKAQVTENKQTIDMLTDKVSRLNIKSPVNGLVKKIEIATVGGIIGSGQPIMEILPIDQEMVVEVKIEPSDIGHIKLGQKADVRISSYDYSQYGAIEGKLSYISASTFESKDAKTYYLGRIALDRHYIGDEAEQLLILPGMTVQSHIVIGNNTVLSHVLKPIHR